MEIFGRSKKREKRKTKFTCFYCCYPRDATLLCLVFSLETKTDTAAERAKEQKCRKPKISPSFQIVCAIYCYQRFEIRLLVGYCAFAFTCVASA